MQGVLDALTNKAVEKRVLERVALKTSTYGQDVTLSTTAQTDPANLKLDPKKVMAIYHDYIIPMTKEVEVEYLLRRLGHPTVAYAGGQSSLAHSAAELFFKHPVVLDEKVSAWFAYSL